MSTSKLPPRWELHAGLVLMVTDSLIRLAPTLESNPSSVDSVVMDGLLHGTDDDDFPGWLIFLIAFAVLLILAAVAYIVYRCCWRKIKFLNQIL